MNELEAKYSLVSRTLGLLKKQQENIIDEQKKIKTILLESVNKTRVDYEQQRADLEKKISRTKALIEIAQTHTSKHVASEEPLPYDQGQLSRLAVQINSENPRDPFAEKLYTVATGQMKSLEIELEQLAIDEEKTKRVSGMEYADEFSKLQEEYEKNNSQIEDYLNGREPRELFSMIQARCKMFAQGHDDTCTDSKGVISVGTVTRPLPVCHGCESTYSSIFGDYCNVETESLFIPADISFNSGSVLVVNYKNESEGRILKGLQNLIVNFGQMYGDVSPQVHFIDPIRYNASSLGALSVLCGNQGALIEEVPSSVETIKKVLRTLTAELNQFDINGNEYTPKKHLIIVHNYPQGYESSVVSQVQQLCVNAKHYGINVILTTNTSLSGVVASDVINYIKSFSTVIDEDVYYDFEKNSSFPFEWFAFSGEIPRAIIKRYIDERPIIDRSSVYEKRIGVPVISEFHKGHRRLENIPYGIDRSGDIQSISFEDSNFATFICGASRSGKSTLLHTLITGIIKNTHPDDVEMWLIDFKMTEFSRYTNHLPPHVRYIILDESPELVYDIINRLTEILQKRQNIFKGKWLKLDDVPLEKYMPAIIVIIDEFSVMSQIIADSIVNSKDNYSIKLQTLLAKGAALGLHFIFASQGFTSGTRGLNDFSKKQIQQRIAMKTEFNEIRETLDLKSASDDDKAMMEQLPVHHVLTRTPVDRKGNHLKLSEVLYISEYANQERMIDSMSNAVKPAPKYYPGDNKAYIDKRTMIIDGNIYLTFNEKAEDIKDFIKSHRDIVNDGDTGYVFFGEPRRMMPIYPVEVSRGFNENILIVSPNTEKMSATSIILSLEQSLQFQHLPLHIWTSKRNSIYKQYIGDCKGDASIVYKELPDICEEIRGIKQAIERKEEAKQFYVLLGFESMIMDMEFQDGSNHENGAVPRTKRDVLSEISVEKRNPGDLDLLSKLMAAEEGVLTISDNKNTDIDFEVNDEIAISKDVINKSAYDAREDLKYIFTHGPNLGYHFVVVFNSVGEMKQSKINTTLFRHKIMFRAPRQEAMEVVGSSGAGIISELDDHSFRYTDGIESVSFRPYLHKGLSWDGWKIGDGGVVDSFEDEDEYLL